MRFWILLTVALIVATVSTSFADDKKPDDWKLMVGKWKVVEATVDGEAVKDVPPFIVKSERFGGTEDSISYRVPKQLFTIGSDEEFDESGYSRNFGFNFNPKTEPAQFHLSRSYGGKIYSYPGIYNFNGDRLEMCLNPVWGKKEFPVEFASPKQSGLTHLIFERVKE